MGKRYQTLALQGWLLISAMIYALPAVAQDNKTFGIQGLSLSSMLERLSTQVPNLMRLVTAIAYVLGMYFIITGVMRLKHLGESRTMMSQEHSVKGPLIFLTVGALLLYLPTSIQVGISTFWSSNPYSYVREQDQWSQFINAVFLIVQFVGVIAFIRGLVILSHIADRGGQPGTFGKGLTHIIGGILCINIYQFVLVINTTFGIQWQSY